MKIDYTTLREQHTIVPPSCTWTYPDDAQIRRLAAVRPITGRAAAGGEAPAGPKT